MKNCIFVPCYNEISFDFIVVYDDKPDISILDIIEESKKFEKSKNCVMQNVIKQSLYDECDVNLIRCGIISDYFYNELKL
jgi:hypothetical protein